MENKKEIGARNQKNRKVTEGSDTNQKGKEIIESVNN